MRLVLLALAAILNVSCSVNLFTDMADRTSEEAIRFEAERLMGEGFWTEAIAEINKLPQTSLEKADIRTLLASAYAGRCGLNLIHLSTLLDDLSTTNGLFAVMMDLEKLDYDYTDCKEAEDQLQAIGDAADRTEDQNLLMAFAGLTKIGAVLADLADQDNDGVVDSAAPDFNACTDIPGEEAKEMVVSMSFIATSFAQVTAVGGGTKTAMQTLCTATPSFCQNEETTDVDATEIQSIRTLINSSPNPNKIGLNSGPVCP